MSQATRNLVDATCPGCGTTRKLRRYHAATDPMCVHCTGALNAQPWRLANPSNPEKNLIRQLGEMGIQFQREVFFKGYLLDFVIRGTHVIEVNGGRIHTMKDPQREARRIALIEESFPLLVITDGNTKHCKTLIKEFLNR